MLGAIFEYPLYEQFQSACAPIDNDEAMMKLRGQNRPGLALPIAGEFPRLDVGNMLTLLQSDFRVLVDDAGGWKPSSLWYCD